MWYNLSMWELSNWLHQSVVSCVNQCGEAWCCDELCQSVWRSLMWRWAVSISVEKRQSVWRSVNQCGEAWGGGELCWMLSGLELLHASNNTVDLCAAAMMCRISFLESEGSPYVCRVGSIYCKWDSYMFIMSVFHALPNCKVKVLAIFPAAWYSTTACSHLW